MEIKPYWPIERFGGRNGKIFVCLFGPLLAAMMLLFAGTTILHALENRHTFFAGLIAVLAIIALALWLKALLTIWAYASKTSHSGQLQ